MIFNKIKFKKLISSLLCGTALFFIQGFACAMEKDTQINNKQSDAIFSHESMLPELWSQIFQSLSPHDLRSMRETSKFHNTQVVQYIEEQLLTVAKQLNTFSPKISNDQIGGILSKFGKQYRYTLSWVLETEMHDNKFLLALPRSPVAFYMYNQPGFEPLTADIMMKYIEPAKELYRALFDCDLPLNNRSNTKTALKHLLAAWPLQTVFFKKWNEAQGASAFFEMHTETLKEQLQTLRKKKPYVSLMHYKSLLKHTNENSSNIVVSCDQLEDENILDILTDFSDVNQETTFILSVETGQFVADGTLKMYESNEGYDVGRFFRHLVLVNPQGDIKTLADQTFIGWEFKTLDLSGLTNIETIDAGFLLDCTNLTSLDISSLTHITAIPAGCIWDCTSLKSIDLSALTNVTTIGERFLAESTSLTSVDLSGLTNVTTIGERFLAESTSLTSVDLSGLTNVTTIGDDFLAGCNNLSPESQRSVNQFLEDVKKRQAELNNK